MLFYMIALSASEKEVKLQYVERLAYGNADLKLHFSLNFSPNLQTPNPVKCENTERKNKTSV
jgi:hypothetical protein